MDTGAGSVSSGFYCGLPQVEHQSSVELEAAFSSDDAALQAMQMASMAHLLISISPFGWWCLLSGPALSTE